MGAPAIPTHLTIEQLAKLRIAPQPCGEIENVPVLLLDGKPLQLNEQEFKEQEPSEKKP